MPVTQTSKKAYKEISEDNTRSKQADTIYKIVKDICDSGDYKNLSLREIKSFTRYDINAVSGRVNELKKDGKFVEDDKRKCNISGRLITPVRTLTMQEIVDRAG
tara:strand:- start:2051 stop:2362 length:312 start_codon:yes stop_codon:yes gene_type:complete